MIYKCYTNGLIAKPRIYHPQCQHQFYLPGMKMWAILYGNFVCLKFKWLWLVINLMRWCKLPRSTTFIDPERMCTHSGLSVRNNHHWQKSYGSPHLWVLKKRSLTTGILRKVSPLPSNPPPYFLPRPVSWLPEVHHRDSSAERPCLRYIIRCPPLHGRWFWGTN